MKKRCCPRWVLKVEKEFCRGRKDKDVFWHSGTHVRLDQAVTAALC